MDFIIKFNLKSSSIIRIKYCNVIYDEVIERNILYIEKLVHLDYIEKTDKGKKQIAIGDVIMKNNISNFTDCKGLYYLININEHLHSIQIQADRHGLLPVYFAEETDFVLISSSFYLLSKHLKYKTANLSFYHQLSIIFTQLNHESYYKEIKRLGYGEILEINSSISVKSINRFYNNFIESPKSLKSSISDIASTFIEISKYYIQDPCAISLTGGFDGRTITGCAHYHKSDYINFSYGRRGNGDVDNPIFIANRLGLRYQFIELEQNYLDTEYSACVQNYIKLSGGYNGFQFPQSYYYPKLIGRERKIIVTGYLGSEVLASAKSGNDEIDPQSILDLLKKSSRNNNYAYYLKKKLLDLNLIQGTNDIDETLDKAEDYFKSIPDHLTNNQKYATFGYENTFRNVFGVWIYNGMHFAKIRVPFMDSDFFNQVSKTQVSQFYGDFLQTKLLKRIQGQMLYPTILSKVWPELNALTSSKGYPPKDVLTITGNLSIAINRMKNKFKLKEIHGLDRMSTITGATSFIGKNLQTSDFDFNGNELAILINEDTLSRALCFLALTKQQSQIIFH